MTATKVPGTLGTSHWLGSRTLRIENNDVKEALKNVVFDDADGWNITGNSDSWKEKKHCVSDNDALVYEEEDDKNPVEVSLKTQVQMDDSKNSQRRKGMWAIEKQYHPSPDHSNGKTALLIKLFCARNENSNDTILICPPQKKYLKTINVLREKCGLPALGDISELENCFQMEVTTLKMPNGWNFHRSVWSDDRAEHYYHFSTEDQDEINNDDDCIPAHSRIVYFLRKKKLDMQLCETSQFKSEFELVSLDDIDGVQPHLYNLFNRTCSEFFPTEHWILPKSRPSFVQPVTFSKEQLCKREQLIHKLLYSET